VLDTTQAATDTVNYVATDSQGLTSISTRTVIIQAANDNTPPSTQLTPPRRQAPNDPTGLASG
jgi:hypothetical protein